MADQRRLDLAQLDPEAAHLDLESSRPELELAVGTPADDVTGPVKAGDRRTDWGRSAPP
jgi:hypothetical protein